MKKPGQIVAKITFVFLVLSILWLLYLVYAYHEIKVRDLPLDTIENWIYIGYIPRLLLLFSFGVLLLQSLKNGGNFKFLIILSIIFWIFSFIFMLTEPLGLHDIMHEYVPGTWPCQGEWSILYISLTLHTLFYTICLYTIYKIIRSIDPSGARQKSIIDETIFEITQYVGIICSLSAIAIIARICVAYWKNSVVMPKPMMWVMSITWIIIFLPYMSVILYWFLKLIHDKNRSMYDEKQKQDLATSGLITWLVSLPLATAFFMINHGRIIQISESVYFPLYLFTTLLIFSTSVLYRFKRV
jgi:hypothetical protein